MQDSTIQDQILNSTYDNVVIFHSGVQQIVDNPYQFILKISKTSSIYVKSQINMDDISKINDKIWSMGEQRAEIIAPLAKSSICSRQMVLEASNKLNLPLDPIKGIFDD